jgi:hypothetical protein
MAMFQLAIFTLKETLGISIVFPQNRFSVSLPPNRPSEINFLKAITTEEVQELKAKMAKLFSQYKKYTSSTDLGRIEDQMTEAFLDALMKPFNPDSKIKPALHHLLNMFPLETFRYEATTFVKAVESEVNHLLLSLFSKLTRCSHRQVTSFLQSHPSLQNRNRFGESPTTMLILLGLG